MMTFCKKNMRYAVLALLTLVIVLLAVLTAAADEFTVAAILSADGVRRDYSSMDAAIDAAQSGDTLVILNDWTPTVSVTFPVGVTVLVPGGVRAGNDVDNVIVTILGSLKSTGTLIGSWQMQSNVTVSWDIDGNGTVDERVLVQYGEVPTHADGYRAREGMYVYNFAGWDKAIAPATEDVTYTARFTRVVSDFTVGWDLDGNGTVDTVGSYGYGEVPAPPAEGAKPDDVAKTYKFIGWDSEIQPVSADVVYTAVFSSSPRIYTISLDTNGDGAIEQVLEKPYGAPLKPDNGQRAETADYTFAFDSWTPALEDVTADATYYAQFITVPKRDTHSAAGTMTVSMLNAKNEEQTLIVSLESQRTVYAARPVTVGAGKNESMQFTNLPDGIYSVTVRDLTTNGCAFVGITAVTGGEGTCAVMLTGAAPVFTTQIDEELNVIAVDLPEALLNREVSVPDAGLTAKDWETDSLPSLDVSMNKLGADAPFHETLEKAAANQKIGLFMQVTASKTVNGEVTELTRVTEAITVLLALPEDMLKQMKAGTDGMAIYRVCAGVTDKLTETPNLYGEYFTVGDDGVLTLYLRTGGTYAIAYNAPDAGFPLWWILLLFDAAGAFVLYIDRRKKPLDYPVRLSAALGLTAVVVTVLALRQGVMEIVFASLGWVLLTLLICLSGSGTHRKKNESLHIKFSLPKEEAADGDEAQSADEKTDEKENGPEA